ncbi:MAG: EscN/YscN/HrcN family type III secretion system ATPase, partial [Phycisphaerae bacterium]|nr:EscN/YscN/HrcN family type III secretion system ATPase [Phycisphaerae bacterium]
MTLFDTYRQILHGTQAVGVAGRVSGVRGLTVSVADFPTPIGAACKITRGNRDIDARVIGFAGAETLVMPMGAMAGICRGDRVVLTCSRQSIGVGGEMLGRVLDGFARPLDGRGKFGVETRVSIWPEPIAAMRRRRITEPLPTGVRVIDAMLTVGCGQRMGIFSGSGVGKSVLLGMIGRHTSADVTVVALIGERGREVRDFIERDLGAEGLARSVVVVSTS